METEGRQNVKIFKTKTLINWTNAQNYYVKLVLVTGLV